EKSSSKVQQKRRVSPISQSYYLKPCKAKKHLKLLKFNNLKRFKAWKHTDSNRGPSACKADALNQLSYASICKNLLPFPKGVQRYTAILFLQILRRIF